MQGRRYRSGDGADEASDQICLAFASVVKLGLALGIRPLNEHDGCWEHQIDAQWWIAVNGHREPMHPRGATLPPFCVYVEYNGWPAGIIDPRGGVIAAGECANEDAFIAALEAAIGAAQQEQPLAAEKEKQG